LEKAEENLRLYGKISPTWKDRPFYTLFMILINALWIVPVLLFILLGLGETFNTRIP
jgi:fumarate reductase subunit C